MNEIAASLIGAMRLFRRDAAGLQDFNMTEDGFWRSFFAMALAGPMAICTSLILSEPGNHAASALIARNSATLVLQWFAFVMLMYYFTLTIGLAHRFMHFVIVSNWCTVVASGIILVPALFHVFGLTSRSLSLFAAFFLLIVMLSYYWFVARETLETSGGVAASVVAIDFFLEFLIESMLGLH
ncbi:MAG: hypothetical protein AAF441_06895 [Pseudomonadota bacterium]